MTMIVPRLLSRAGLKSRGHRHFSPRLPNKVFFQGGGVSVDSWTPGPKPLCHRHPTGPQPSGLLWTPANDDSTKSDFALAPADAAAQERIAERAEMRPLLAVLAVTVAAGRRFVEVRLRVANRLQLGGHLAGVPGMDPVVLARGGEQDRRIGLAGLRLMVGRV